MVIGSICIRTYSWIQSKERCSGTVGEENIAVLLGVAPHNAYLDPDILAITYSSYKQREVEGHLNSIKELRRKMWSEKRQRS